MNQSVRFCTESPPGITPLFFIGCSPSMASTILSPDYPAAGVMVSINQLQNRQSDFVVGDWILDSGAFTEVARHGGYRQGVETYYHHICRWSQCGNLLIAVSQDWMCEPFVLKRTGLSIAEHQRLTIERYDQLLNLNPPVTVMPVLQGYRSSDYLIHLQQYGARLSPGAWVGVGSICKRNGNPSEIENILLGIKLLRPDLKLHGFGIKAIALENPQIRELLHSCDSMAWSYPQKLPAHDSVQNRTARAWDYQQKISARLNKKYQRPTPPTAGAGNGQGRKSKWRTPGKTKAICVPEIFADELLALARNWDNNN